MTISIPVKDLRGRQVAKLGLNEAVFGVDMNESVVYQALVRQRANERQGTASAKTRGEVSGSTRKPWRQKHTGRARVGTRMSPLWRHGGVIFGPKPRSYTKALPKKMRRLAIRCLLSDKQRGSELSVVKEIKLEGKTREVVSLFEALDVAGAGVLIVTESPDAGLMRGAQNLDRVKTVPAAQLNVGDLLKYQFLVMTVEAVRAAERIWARRKIDRKRVLGMAIEEEEIPEAIEEPVEIEPEPEPEPEPVAEVEADPAEADVEAVEAAAEPEAAETEPAAPEAAAKDEADEEAPRPRRRRAPAARSRSRSARTRSTKKKADDKPPDGGDGAAS